jgi:hypothetical protein
MSSKRKNWSGKTQTMSDLDDGMLARIGECLSNNATNEDLNREFGINRKLAAKCVVVHVLNMCFCVEIYDDTYWLF